MVKIFTAFSGYDSQCLALRDAGIEYESVGTSEIDKYAIIANNSLHGKGEVNLPSYGEVYKYLIDKNIGYDFKKKKTTLHPLRKEENEKLYIACKRINNFGDISKIDETQLPDHNVFTYSFPCTSVSVSGKQKGLVAGEPSGLLWECERIIKHNKSLILLMENVKNLVGKKFKPDFDKWCKKLEEMGYTNHWQVVNAKEHGIPQNRERVFMVSISDGFMDYEFPEKEELKIFLKDILEPEVDEKYYLKPEQYTTLLENLKVTGKLNVNPSGRGMNGNVSAGNVSPTLTTNKGEGLKIAVAARQVGRNPDNPKSREVGLPTKQMLETEGKEVSNCLTTVQKDSLVAEIIKVGSISSSQDGVVVDPDGVSPTHTSGHGNCPKIIEKKIVRYERTEYGKQIRKDYEAGKVDEKIGNMRVPTLREDGISNTLTTVQKDNHLAELKIIQKPRGFNKGGIKEICPPITSSSWQENNHLLDGIRVRKLTPKECFRLMNVKDEDFNKIQKALNETFYKGKDRSSSQLYKLAGNSIVVRPLMKIFKNLLT